MKGNEVFDITEALLRTDGDMELFQELAGIFLESYSKQLADVENAIEKNDMNALESAAHSIKGSVGVFCAKPAFDVALKLEMMGRENNMSEACEAYKVLSVEIERLCRALETIDDGTEPEV